MSGYLAGMVVILSLNTILAYAVFLPVATGQLNLGGAAFQAVGAYVAGYLSSVYGASIPVMLCASAATSGFIAFLLALTILRTKGVYLVLATFAFAQFVGGIIINVEVLGGAMGMTVPEHVDGVIIVVAAVLVVFVVMLLMQTRFGLAMRAIHDDDTVAELMGIGVRRTQVAAFTIGGIIAGIAGALYGFYFNFVEMQSFDSVSSVYLLLFVLLGGTQTVWGPLIGATFFTIVPELFRFVVAHVSTGGTGQLDTSWRFIILGIITVFMMVLRPEGILTRTGLGRLLGFKRATPTPREV